MIPEPTVADRFVQSLVAAALAGDHTGELLLQKVWDRLSEEDKDAFAQLVLNEARGRVGEVVQTRIWSGYSRSLLHEHITGMVKQVLREESLQAQLHAQVTQVVRDELESINQVVRKELDKFRGRVMRKLTGVYADED